MIQFGYPQLQVAIHVRHHFHFLFKVFILFHHSVALCLALFCINALQMLDCSFDLLSFSWLRESLKVFDDKFSISSALDRVEIHGGLHLQVLGQDLDGGLVVALL